MPRTCTCNDLDNCSRCRVYETNPAYADWALLPTGWDIPCRHRGEEIRRVACSTAAGTVQRKVFACAKYEECTATMHLATVAGCCAGCGQHEPLQPFGGKEIVRHLLYHIYPLRGNDSWRWNVRQLLRRIDLFNGRRVVAIVTDDTTEDARTVQAAFGEAVSDYLVLSNDATLREVRTLVPLLECIRKDVSSDSAVFWGHAKGVTRAGNAAVRLWTEMLYEVNLDYWPVVAEQLARYPITGAMKKVGAGFTGHDHSDSTWHYSGSFFWVRGADLFARDWRRIDQRWFGIESAPSLWFSAQEAGHLLADSPVESMNLYDLPYVLEKIGPAFDSFRRTNRDRLSLPLRIELGGGTKPRPGFVNLDQIPEADVVLDLARDTLPFEDDAVSAVYSSHCLEHVSPYRHLLHEIARVCRIGAEVEIRVPSWLSSMALCAGHEHTISESQVRHWTTDFVADWWGGCAKRLRLQRTDYSHGETFAEWRTIFPQLTAEQLLRLCPGACHDIRFHFEVIENR